MNLGKHSASIFNLGCWTWSPPLKKPSQNQAISLCDDMSKNGRLVTLFCKFSIKGSCAWGVVQRGGRLAGRTVREWTGNPGLTLQSPYTYQPSCLYNKLRSMRTMQYLRKCSQCQNPCLWWCPYLEIVALPPKLIPMACCYFFDLIIAEFS